MGFKELFIAIGLVLIFEGLIPFISPSFYKRSLLQLKEIHENYLRIFGLVLIILGVIIINFI
ncbi:uncharacterized protein METZ01_LOCUS497842 [marine metagenome]|jgi:hypothetical protein|uniref:DUF2065 domain-containing protein n=1 Tax=marine metagenome TaxID=408172 RepID=A0A383DMA4_9ZZZZ|tara:strand:+ start:60 stop:245 length:186 start_codon:yes stop_codon:yes gene_type:complete